MSESVLHSDRKRTLELRREVRGRLAALSALEKRDLWSCICARMEADWVPVLLAEEAARPPSAGPLTIGLFHPLPDEFPVLEFASVLEAKLVRSPRFLFPRVSSVEPPHLEFHSSGAGLHDRETGRWGILEPSESEPVIPLSEADWVWVPGLVFGEEGERIGRGKGFYDRALAAAPGTRRLAVAAEFQVVKAPPQHAGDQRMDWIFTESRLILPACATRQNGA